MMRKALLKRASGFIFIDFCGTLLFIFIKNINYVMLLANIYIQNLVYAGNKL